MLNNINKYIFFILPVILSALVGVYQWMLETHMDSSIPSNAILKAALIGSVLSLSAISINIFSEILWSRPDRSWIKGSQISFIESSIIIVFDINETMTMNFLNIIAKSRIKCTDDSWVELSNISHPLNIMHKSDLTLKIRLPENHSMNDVIQIYVEAKSDHNGNVYIWTDSFQLKEKKVSIGQV